MNTEKLEKFSKKEILEYLQRAIYFPRHVEASRIYGWRWERLSKELLAAMDANRYPMTQDVAKRYNAIVKEINEETDIKEKLKLYEKLKPFDDMKKRYLVECNRITEMEKKADAAEAAFNRELEAEQSERKEESK